MGLGSPAPTLTMSQDFNPLQVFHRDNSIGVSKSDANDPYTRRSAYSIASAGKYASIRFDPRQNYDRGLIAGDGTAQSR